MELMSNLGLTLSQLFRKRDLLQELINIGYELEPEMDKVLEAINEMISNHGDINDNLKAKI